VQKKRSTLLAGVCVAALIGIARIAAGTGTPASPPRAVSDDEIQSLTTTVGGADVLPTTRTIPHWWGSSLNPHDGVTYGYNIVGADPFQCTGSNCSVTIEVDITPIVVNIDGMTFSGNDVLGAVLASPIFALSDYGFTPYASSSPTTISARGPGGVLSQDDGGIPLQLQDAVMRAQFDRTGASAYHLKLHPNVLPAVTIDIPNNQGFLFQGARGNIFAAVAFGWWTSRIHNLVTKANPTHLAVYLTDDVRLFTLNLNKAFCCFDGYHSASQGTPNSNGNAVVNTFLWTSYLSPGIVARPDGTRFWAFQDILPLSHEIAEWANDPFVGNAVERWGIPDSPGLICQGLLETGDPVSNVGFAMGTNSFRQGPNPNGTQSADGYYHPEDEVTVPWFMRLAPNLISERTQLPSLNIGRYTFLGSLNTFGFNIPSQGC